MALSAETDFICSVGTITTTENVLASMNALEIVSYQLTIECDTSMFKYMHVTDPWTYSEAGTLKWSGRITAAVPTGGVRVTDLAGFVSAKTKIEFKLQYQQNNAAVGVATYTGQAVITSASLKFTSKDVSMIDIEVIGDGALTEAPL